MGKNNSKLCQACGEKNNPAFTSCWKCKAQLENEISPCDSKNKKAEMNGQPSNKFGTDFKFVPDPTNAAEASTTLMMFGTQEAHFAVMGAVGAIETLAEGEIDLGKFKPSANKNEFEEMLIFWMFCLTMLGCERDTRYRNFIIDTMKLTVGYLLVGISSKQTAQMFDEKFYHRWHEYQSYLNTCAAEKGKKQGDALQSLCICFAKHVEKEYPVLAMQILQRLTTKRLFSQERQSLVGKLPSGEIGRNMSLQSIIDFTEHIALINRVSPEDKKINHLQEMHELLGLYYRA